ncbi:EmrB/QacA subfamily drug resistance transporter [Nocardiopsis sp. Huas11]|uniref:MFS transporter n=1 Tax=Nocardiopsis sp. Huas11 TaxID=2183912 RepID=UPI000EB3FDB5|nr:MFS transporter [Nocardiopsis sp. Huas11]RKS10375.1 EmrB/QacA subfamily drug resistance transporter [Nocardiopsis sp. Huas11]
MVDQAHRDAPEVPLSPRRRTAALVVLLIGLGMDVLDGSILYVALPTIQRDLSASGSHLQWLAAGYALPFALAMITGSRLGDIHGRRRVFLFGMVLFSATSLVCGLAGSVEVLIAARVAQGLAAALMVPQVMATIQVMYPPGRRGIAIAASSAVFAVTTVFGPVLGGLLLSLDIADLGWRVIFLVNVPICVLAAVATLMLVPESRASSAIRLDLVGVLLATLGMVALLYPLIVGAEQGWPLWSVVTLVLSVPLLALFVLHQRRRHSSPLVELSLFARRSFTGGLVVMMLCMGGVSGFSLVFTIYLQSGLGYDALAAALTQMPWGLAAAVFAVLSIGVLAPRLGRRVVAIGMAVTIVGMTALVGVTMTADGSTGGLVFLVPLALGGAGMGMGVALVFDFALHDVPVADAGSASGLLNTLQQVSIAMGVALVGALYFVLLPGTDPAAPAAEAAGSALSATVLLPLAMIAVALLAVRALPRFATQKEDDAA